MTAVAVMDRDGWDQCTDVIVVVDAQQRELVWVPRDLWSGVCDDRINRAYAIDGPLCLIKCLKDLGFADLCTLLCVLPAGIAKLIERIEVEVPVEKPMRFIYPLEREGWTEDGYRTVEFNPPFERLKGDRVHEWLGARKAVPGSGDRYSDLDRVKRQQILVHRLLETKFDFLDVDYANVRITNPGWDGLMDMAQIKTDYTLRTFGEGRLTDSWIKGKNVLILQ